MKKTYINPTFLVVEINCGAICQLLIGSGGTDATTGNGVDLVKEENPPINDVNVWDDEW